MVHANSGGPDFFGYSYIDSFETDEYGEPIGPVYDFEDIAATGNQLFLEDDMSVSHGIGFTFNFYGTDYTEA